MTRKEKLALRQHQSTRQLMGMQGIASHGITTSNSELVFSSSDPITFPFYHPRVSVPE